MHDTGISSDAGATLGHSFTGTPAPTGTVVVHAATPDDMKRIGAVLARLLRPGDTVLLGGELGAGKTTLTQGLAAELGVVEPVTSPTFVLVHSYKTAAGWDLLHADVWRLEHLHEVIDLALPELLEDGAAAVIEWGEIAAPALAPDWLHVAITYVLGPSDGGPYDSDFGSYETAAVVEAGRRPAPAAAGRRRLVFRAFGPSWQSRVADLSRTWAGTSTEQAS
jgi:tRNA threonylcarbamoyladenosine biosynthesis protein TsaE